MSRINLLKSKNSLKIAGIIAITFMLIVLWIIRANNPLVGLELSQEIAGNFDPQTLRQFVKEGLAAIEFSTINKSYMLFFFGLILPALAIFQIEQRRFGTTIFLLSLLLLLIITRIGSLVAGPLNPDESFIVAAIYNLQKDPLSWRSFVGGTHWPLTHIIPTIPTLFGFVPDYASIRLIGIFLIFGMSAFIFLGIRILSSELVAALATYSFTLFTSSLNHYDLLAYNAELPSLFFLGMAFYGLCRFISDSSNKSAVIIGAASGFLALTKLQGLPIMAGILLIIFINCIKCKKGLLKKIAVIALSAFLTFIPLPLWAILSGYGRELLEVSFKYTFIYAQRTGLSLDEKIKRIFEFLYQSDIQLELASVFIVSLFIVVLITSIFYFKKLKIEAYRYISFALLPVIIIPSTIYCIAAPGNLFYHYFNFLIFPLCITFSISYLLFYNITKLLPANFIYRYLLYVPSILLACISFYNLNLNGKDNWIANSKDALPVLGSRVGVAILSLAKPGEELAIWGWANELYPYTGMLSATRYGETALMMTEGEQRAYFRNQYIQLLRSNPPPVFVDSSGPASFIYQDRSKYGFESFPELADFVKVNYKFYVDLDGFRVFVWKARFAAIKENLKGSSEIVDCAIRLCKEINQQACSLLKDSWSLTNNKNTNSLGFLNSSLEEELNLNNLSKDQADWISIRCQAQIVSHMKI